MLLIYMQYILFYTIVSYISYIFYSPSIKLLEQFINPASLNMYITGGGTIIIGIYNIIYTPSFYKNQDNNMSLSDISYLFLTGFLNSLSSLFFYQSLNYAKNPAKFIAIQKCEILASSIICIFIYHLKFYIVDIVSPILTITGIYLIYDYNYLYDKINIYDNDEENQQSLLIEQIETAAITTCYSSLSPICITSKDIIIIYLLKWSNISYEVIIQSYFLSSTLTFGLYKYLKYNSLNVIYLDNVEYPPNDLIPFLFVISITCYSVHISSTIMAYNIYKNIAYIKIIISTIIALNSVISKLVLCNDLYNKECLGIVLLLISPCIIYFNYLLVP